MLLGELHSVARQLVILRLFKSNGPMWLSVFLWYYLDCMVFKGPPENVWLTQQAASPDLVIEYSFSKIYFASKSTLTMHWNPGADDWPDRPRCFLKFYSGISQTLLKTSRNYQWCENIPGIFPRRSIPNRAMRTEDRHKCFNNSVCFNLWNSSSAACWMDFQLQPLSSWFWP